VRGGAGRGASPSGRREPPPSADCARATGQLAKTDRIDAEILARFADTVRPETRTLPTVEAQALDALLTRRRQLLEMLGAERNRLAEAVTGTVVSPKPISTDPSACLVKCGSMLIVRI